MAFIHVIIPVYNAKKYLREAVQSVLAQPCKDIEIILVNDGSTDGSADLCDELAAEESRISVIHQQNRGVSAARNAGIEKVLERGTDGYIAFLDADDMWADDFLDENTYAHLCEGYDLVGFLSASCNSLVTRRTQISPMKDGIYKGGNKSVWITARQHFGAAFYRVVPLAQYRICFPVGIKDNEDWMFAMQFKYVADRLCLVNKLLYLYRNNRTSVTHKNVPAILKYVPMIHAYLSLDKSMQQYKDENRGVLSEGRAMAAVYIVDVFEEHYKQLGSKRALDKMMKENPEFEELITSPFAINRPDSGLRWQKMQAHPVRFRIRYNLKGIVFYPLQKVYRFLSGIAPIAKYLDRVRYPIEI